MANRKTNRAKGNNSIFGGAPSFTLKRVLRHVRNMRIMFFIKLFVLALLYWMDWKFKGDTLPLGIGKNLLASALFFLTGHVITDLTRQILIFFYVRKHELTGSVQASFITGVGRFAGVASVILLSFSVLILLEINTIELFASLSIVAAGIAILSKDYITTMVNGMVLMFGNHLALDDYIKVGEYKGRVVDITLLDLVLRTDEEELIMIPNNTAMQRDIVNYTKRPIKRISIDFEVGLPMHFELDELAHYLIDSLQPWKENIALDSYLLKVVEVKKDAAELRFQYTFCKPDREVEKRIRRLLLEKVIRFLDRVPVRG